MIKALLVEVKQTSTEEYAICSLACKAYINTLFGSVEVVQREMAQREIVQKERLHLCSVSSQREEACSKYMGPTCFCTLLIFMNKKRTERELYYISLLPF